MAELAAVLALVATDLWLVWDRPGLLVLVRALAATVIIASVLRRREHRRATISTATPRQAWLEAAAVTLILGLAVVAWATVASGPFDEPNPPPLAASALSLWLVHRVTLAIVQQLVLQLFLGPAARQVLGGVRLAAVAVATVFGLFHLPSAPFAIATAVAALLWLGLYQRSQRLAPLIASHALLAILASTLPDRLFLDMKVGAPALEIAADQRALAAEETQALLGAVSSPRYASYRGGTGRGYVDGLYRDVLGRVATGDEIDRGVDQLRKITRLELAKRMLLAEELDETTLWRRFIDDEPLAPGIEINPTSSQASRPEGAPAVSFTGWYDAEGEWRWARDPAPAISFGIDREPGRDYVLAVSGGAATPVTVGIELNGELAGTDRFTDLTPRDHRRLLGSEQLDADGDNTLRFLVVPEQLQPEDTRAPAVLEGDPRALGFGLRQLRLAPLRLPSAAILHTDDDYFLEGFSVAEERLRWTLEPTARLVYPLREIEADGCYALQLEAGAFERQGVSLLVGGQRIADWTFDGLEPQRRTAHLDGDQLSPGPNLVDFQLPDARSPEGDPRRLGLAFISLRIYPLKDCG